MVPFSHYEPLAGDFRTTARGKAFVAPLLVFIDRGHLNAIDKDSTTSHFVVSVIENMLVAILRVDYHIGANDK
jgi:hypothetical protein